MNKNNFIFVLILTIITFRVSTFCQNSNSIWKIKVGTEKNQFPVIDVLAYYDFEVNLSELFVCDIVNAQIWRFDIDSKVLGKYSLPSQPEIIHRYKDDLFVLLTSGQLVKIHLSETDHKVIECKLPVLLNSNYEVMFGNNSLIVPNDNIAQGDAFSINLDTITKVETIKGLYNFDKRFEKQLSQKQKIQFKLVDVCGCSNDAIILEKIVGEKGHSGKSEYFYLNNKTDVQIPLNSLSEELTGLILHTNVCTGFKIYPDVTYSIGMTFSNGMEDYLITTRVN